MSKEKLAYEPSVVITINGCVVVVINERVFEEDDILSLGLMRLRY